MAQILPQNNSENSDLKKMVRMYYKIGGYFKMSWQDFRDTPWPVLKELSKMLDEREGDMKQFIGYEESAMFKNLKRMFPSDTD